MSKSLAHLVKLSVSVVLVCPWVVIFAVCCIFNVVFIELGYIAFLYLCFYVFIYWFIYSSFNNSKMFSSISPFSVSRKSSLLQTRASSEESSSVDANEVFTDLKEKARNLLLVWFQQFGFIMNFLLANPRSCDSNFFFANPSFTYCLVQRRVGIFFPYFLSISLPSNQTLC